MHGTLFRMDCARYLATSLPNPSSCGLICYTQTSAFRVISQKGPKTILGPEYANDIRNNPACNADIFIAKEFHTYVSGFEVLVPSEVMRDAIRIKLTRNIGRRP